MNWKDYKSKNSLFVSVVSGSKSLPRLLVGPTKAAMSDALQGARSVFDASLREEYKYSRVTDFSARIRIKKSSSAITGTLFLSNVAPPASRVAEFLPKNVRPVSKNNPLLMNPAGKVDLPGGVSYGKQSNVFYRFKANKYIGIAWRPNNGREVRYLRLGTSAAWAASNIPEVGSEKLLDSARDIFMKKFVEYTGSL